MSIDEFPEKLYVPNVIDIEVTGRCEFNCKGCWGSKPGDYKKELTAKQWIKIFKKLDDYSFFDWTSRAVITGGEPLLRKDLIEIVDGLSNDTDRQISLSTTGIDHYNQLEKILNKLTSIGIPIDGASPETNSLWRKHCTKNDGGLSMALETLRLIQDKAPDLYTSVRTLVHPGNIASVAEIPKFLLNSGIDISRLRWILYELNERKTSQNDFPKLTSTNIIKSTYGNYETFESQISDCGKDFREIVVRSIGKMAYRNFLINPAGETRAIVPSDKPGESIEFDFGNINKNFKSTMATFNESIYKYFFSLDAADSPEGFYAAQDAELLQ